MACPVPATPPLGFPAAYTAVISWAIGICTPLLLGRLKTAFSAVPTCLRKLDECASAAERAIWCMGGGKVDFADRALALTLRSELGTLTQRAFGSHPEISKRVASFAYELGACDPDSSRAVTCTSEAEHAVEKLRSKQRQLRNEIRGTHRGRLAIWLSGESA